MLTSEEARARRAQVEELYSTHEWLSVRDLLRELAQECQLALDQGFPAPSLSVVEMCEVILRMETIVLTRSWDVVKAEIKRLSKEAAEAELAKRASLDQR